MRTFVVRRLLYGLAVIFLVSFIVFTLSRMAGDPRDLYVDEYTTAESYEAMGRLMGLDKPVPIQYAIWFGNALKGDFGRSLFNRTSARKVIFERIPATLQLTGAAFLFALLTGIPLGVLSAVKRGSIWDFTVRRYPRSGSV
jgi:peptide/nickel transport system permease protein